MKHDTERSVYSRTIYEPGIDQYGNIRFDGKSGNHIDKNKKDV